MNPELQSLLDRAGYKADEHGLIVNPGKFEREPADTLYWFDIAMNGGGEPLGDPESDVLEGEYFEIDDHDREVCGLSDSTKYAILWYSDNGFVSLQYGETDPSGMF